MYYLGWNLLDCCLNFSTDTDIKIKQIYFEGNISTLHLLTCREFCLETGSLVICIMKIACTFIPGQVIKHHCLFCVVCCGRFLNMRFFVLPLYFKSQLKWCKLYEIFPPLDLVVILPLLEAINIRNVSAVN